MEFERRKKIITQLNIAPLIDVVFLLLLFFMISSQFVTQPGIKIHLPAAVSAKPQTEKDNFIFITSQGELYLNNDIVTMENLLNNLKEKLNKTENKTVIIKADEKIDLGLAVKVIDIAKQAKAENLIISTQHKQDVKK